MSVLTGPKICEIVNRTKQFKANGLPPPLPSIDIEPFDWRLAGPNSYDIHLADKLRVYTGPQLHWTDLVGTNPDYWEKNIWLDSRQDNPTHEITIDKYGFDLQPGRLYLGSTVERTRCDGLIPWLDGRSSVGRLGVSIHVTVGRGDDGWEGTWTLEITVVHPTRIYAGMRIGQLTFLTIDGERSPYQGKYQQQDGPTPSRLWQDTDNKGTP